MDDKTVKAPVPQVLLVEDNVADILLLEEAVADAGVELDLRTVHNGDDALAYLHRRPPFENAPRPAFILLDLNLPGKNGFDVLADIKRNGELHRIPVLILSTSRTEVDINRCYDLGANCYISKSSDIDRFIEVMLGVTSFWLKMVELPKIGNGL